MADASSSTSASNVPTEDGMIQDRRQAVREPVPASRVVSKPIPQAQTKDPREFQLGQIRRRFSPKETKHADGALLKFSLSPSDPDFPFEMTALECLLFVPLKYPEARPTLKVGNKDIPRGFSLNVESGFDSLASDKPDASLLELMKALDKNLEAFLSAPKADTVKLVINKDTRHLSVLPSRSVEPATAADTRAGGIATDHGTTTYAKPAETFTEEQKAEALKKRESETRQLEARMGRLPLYKKSGDGIEYTLPLEPRRRAELPVALQAVKTVQLFVPLLYPLQPCRIGFEGVDPGDSEAVIYGFQQKSTEKKETTLMGHINFLAQNMHILAKTPLEPKVVAAEPTPSLTPVAPESVNKGKSPESQQDPDRSHIQYITRPPEWTVIDAEDVSGTDTDDLYSYDTEDETTDEGGGVGVKDAASGEPEPSQAPTQNPERGTAISFPFIELYGIELLEIVVLNITVKCERCKDVTEIKGLKNGIAKSESCRKCASQFSITFRRDFVHAHAVRAGFLDLEGCIVGDMLLSTFIPTCSECSTAYPAPGIVSVQGETTTNVCRECHQKFTFKIPAVKFLRISSSGRLPPASGPRRKKETLGLHAGTELPKRGRCRHYSKSYRWFRFSCCQKVYACDKCHDEEEEHPNEWANRMICGWCSREQNYRPEDCGVCHGMMSGKRGGGGFWEGGKGTRDRVKMSRKDKRKFRRPGGASKT
ncbi:zf-CHY-domain-containing protein [Hyaloscypha variabilis F]|uniref:Zf-CHY-domain-containing protein n=1 Tax=Hyaloscypha variabilis (strain UAMH 11265 / GT02V1 / F) TaxID=1149755 RepID=A0A2J6RAM2_HYAVF|nr:zf-CHY-domain-containing protein [Hyaloscypha variabilis F]